MFRQVFRYPILLVLVLWLQRGTPTSVAELNAQHSEATIRQVKSEEMFKYMNLSADPCENFYEYCCGNFAQYNPITPNQAEIGTLQTLSEVVDSRIQSELNSDDEPFTEVDKKVKSFYKSCLNLLNREYDFRDQLKRVISEFGAIPVLEGDTWWDEGGFDWTKTVAQMIHKTGKSIIFSISVLPGYADNSINRVVIKEPTLAGGDRDFYVGEAFKTARDGRIGDISSHLQTFLGVEEQLAEETAGEILDFEIALAQGLVDLKKSPQPFDVYFLTDIEEVQWKYSYVWDSKTLISDALGVNQDEVYVQTTYLEAAKDALERTPKRVVANYLFYTYLSDFMYERTDVVSELMEYCTWATRTHFYKYFEKLMYRKYQLHQVEETLYSIWRELKTSFRDMLYLPRLDWMREDTRALVIEKLKHMKMIIQSYEQYDFAQEFAQLDLNDYDYVHNINAILTLRGNQARDKIHMPPQAEEMGAQSTGSLYYDPAENKIFVPMGNILPYYMWSSSYPFAFNFASLGFTLAHELMHGFDDMGRHHDARGNNRVFWDPRTDSEFIGRTQCFVDQYKQFKYKGHYLTEMKAQSENIADCSGIRLAYLAYMNWYTKAETNGLRVDMESLPDFNYSHEQLFFISYAQNWCSNSHPEIVAFQLADVHTPDEIRDIGPLANLDEFSKQFNCPLGSTMNPVRKCIIY